MAARHNEKEVSLEKLRAWVNNPDTEVLTQQEKDVWERIDYAYDQLKIETPNNVINRLVKKFNITRAQAGKDISMCNTILAPQNRVDTAWMRNFIINDAMLQIRVAQQTLDQKAWAAARDTIAKIYLAELSTQAPIDPELLGGNNYFAIININGEVQKIDLSKVAEMHHTRREKLTEFLFQDITEENAEVIMNS